jgi:hypothetical protein
VSRPFFISTPCQRRSSALCFTSLCFRVPPHLAIFARLYPPHPQNPPPLAQGRSPVEAANRGKHVAGAEPAAGQPVYVVEADHLATSLPAPNSLPEVSQPASTSAATRGRGSSATPAGTISVVVTATLVVVAMALFSCASKSLASKTSTTASMTWATAARPTNSVASSGCLARRPTSQSTSRPRPSAPKSGCWRTWSTM